MLASELKENDRLCLPHILFYYKYLGLTDTMLQDNHRSKKSDAHF